MFAAGYDLRTEESTKKVFEEFDSVVGWGYLKALHMNDSKGALGCKKDRHESLGKGEIGLPCFRYIMNEPKFHGYVVYTPIASLSLPSLQKHSSHSWNAWWEHLCPRSIHPLLFDGTKGRRQTSRLNISLFFCVYIVKFTPHYWRLGLVPLLPLCAWSIKWEEGMGESFISSNSLLGQHT